MTLPDFRHIRLDEQAAPGSLTTPVIADGAVTPPKIGLLSSVIIQDITYTALNGGVAGNAITVTYVEDAIAGSETINVVGTSITVHIGDSTLVIENIVDGTHFRVTSSANVQVGNILIQGVNSTTVVSIPDASHIEVVDTSGFVVGDISDNNLLSTADQIFTVLSLSFPISRLVTFAISGSGSNKQIGVGPTNLIRGKNSALVQSVKADSSVLLTGDVELASGTNVNLVQAGQVITISSPGTLTPSNFVIGEDLTGQIDGITNHFILANTPITNKEILYLNGIRLRRGLSNDYTISGMTMTMSAPPLIGDSLLADYIK